MASRMNLKLGPEFAEVCLEVINSHFYWLITTEAHVIVDNRLCLFVLIVIYFAFSQPGCYFTTNLFQIWQMHKCPS